VSQLLGGRKVQVDGHFKSKVEHQVEWLMHFKPQLGEGFVRQVIPLPVTTALVCP
jgi:hypothetical protein